jgi:hypothetical protein
VTSSELTRVPVFGNSFREERPVLVVAHPGHELRLFGWLCANCPDVIVLTDGSGCFGPSRIQSSRRLLANVGARPGPLFGAYTDQQIYRGILDGDTPLFTEMATALIDFLRRGRYTMVVTDPFEGYNPSHDLCNVLSNIALRRVSAVIGRSIRLFDYALTGHTDFQISKSLTKMRLSGEVLLAKYAAAERYVELQGEVASAVRKEGEEAYREEVLRELPAEGISANPFNGPPFYESYGERQLATGRYSTVIRYAEHFLPIAQALSGLAEHRDSGRAQRTAR